MKCRKERTEILVSCQKDVLEEMVSVVEAKYKVTILEEPNSGLVMMKMRESAQKHLFYLGEVFVTECKVMIEDTMGLGIISGVNEEKAYLMAVIDAAYNLKINEVSIIDTMLESAKVKIDEIRRKEQSKLLQTKVNFETLDEEVKQ